MTVMKRPVQDRPTASLPEPLQERFEAVVVGQDGGPGERVDGRAVQATLGALRSRGMAVFIATDARVEDLDGQVAAESVAALLDRLWERGIAPELVLVAGDDTLVGKSAGATVVLVGAAPTRAPDGGIVLGGADRLGALLEEQLRRRDDVPRAGTTRGWTLTLDGLDAELERSHETLLVLGDGVLGTNGSPLWSNSHSAPRALAGGLYIGEGPMTELLAAPVWHVASTELPALARLRRVLDLRAGVLHQTLSTPEGEAAALRFSSLARPGTVAMRAHGPPALVRPGVPLRDSEGRPAGEDQADGASTLRARATEGGLVATAIDTGEAGGFERLGAYVVDTARLPTVARGAAALQRTRKAGFDALLSEHRAAWAERWEHADVAIVGDDELQLAVRFALFQLMGSVASSGEAAVGARGLTGQGYRGHVFWDTDVFVLPFFAATHPPAAKAILAYRIRRLPAAMAAARALGFKGARFPWESAQRGIDVTPAYARDHTGRIVPIRTGHHEEHIVADVAWAVDYYLAWTGDEEFAAGPGRDLYVETARYWASRVRSDRAGRAHIYGVIGPDEYHEPVDDNAYTNVMARWNLRRAAAAVDRYGGEVSDTEHDRWLETADAIVDGYNPNTGLYEEFAGFFRLEPLVIADVAPHRPIAADLLLGAERVAGAQVVKQADVLMLHHLLPDEVHPASLAPNLDFYEPRTAHGSSLSPAIHASLFARAERFGRALQALRLAARIDLDDVTGTTAGGLHVATMGGLWQALAFGFAGVRPRGDVLTVDPRLPDGWEALEVRVRFRGVPARIRIRQDGVAVDGGPGLRWEVLER